ncbi:MAG TPA: hypothetical protein PK336_00255 [Methanoculleus sp.]|jgi:hypothetical protein|nr:hypothetical protein [Methanoculleus sp.]
MIDAIASASALLTIVVIVIAAFLFVAFMAWVFDLEVGPREPWDPPV